MNIPNTLTSIGDGIFEGCRGIETVTFSNGITSIPHSCFKNCMNLMNITIPDSVKTIGEDSFSGCRRLHKVTIPSSVEVIQEYALSGCSHIQFVIGGSLGLSDEVLKRADGQLSFSDMTFPHQMMRVVLLEQIYRSYKILSGEPYHK